MRDGMDGYSFSMVPCAKRRPQGEHCLLVIHSVLLERTLGQLTVNVRCIHARPIHLLEFATQRSVYLLVSLTHKPHVSVLNFTQPWPVDLEISFALATLLVINRSAV
jgi:hypothetical protein